MAQRKIVSIHAPSQGATLQKRAWEYISTTFQSTHPHGVRPFRHGRDRHRHTCFNPRTLTGCDCIGCGLMCIFMVFQSTHPHGVRRLTIIGGRNGQGVSIHAPSRGAPIDAGTDLNDITVSIHAPSRGATGIVIAAHRQRNVSIHAPSRGATGGRLGISLWRH